MNPQRKLIAIIDDDFVLRKSLDTLLQAIGFRSESYASAEQFLNECEHCRADCLLVDLDIGGSCGLELIRHPSVFALQCPIILMSATFSTSVMQQAHAAGCAAYLRKPFRSIELLRAILKAAGR